MPDVRDQLSWKWAIVLMMVAYCVGAGARYTWIHYAQAIPSYQWNGVPTSHNRDSFLFGSILQKARLDMHQGNTLVPDVLHHGMITLLPSVLVHTLPISIDRIVIYFPIFIAPLLCIPVLLIGRLYGSTVWGFAAALVAGVANSYYNRTMAGYCDTDMFSVTVPALALYFLLAAARRASLGFAFAASLTLFIYPFFYVAGLPVGYGLGLTFVAYRMFFHRQDRFTWSSIALVSLALLLARFSPGTTMRDQPIAWALALAALIAVYVVLRRDRIKTSALVAMGIVSLGAFLATSAPIATNWAKAVLARPAQVQAPSSQDHISHGAETIRKLNFKDTRSTVKELGTVSAKDVATRSVGSVAGAVMAIVGLGLLCARHREWLTALPLVAIGLFSFYGGLRFTIFAVPVAALGSTYALALAGAAVTSRKPWAWAVVAVGTLALVYPNIRHVLDYKAPVLLPTDAIRTLDAVRRAGDADDFVITWWDYGSATWFFSGCRTLNSPASNQSADNFLVSKILSTTSPRQAANLCRDAVEEFVRKRPRYASAIQSILKDNSPQLGDPAQYLAATAGQDYRPAEKTREVFLFMPAEILLLFPVIKTFSERDLVTGQEGARPDYEVIRQYRLTHDQAVLGNGMRINLTKRTVTLRGKPFRLNTLHVASYGKNTSLDVKTETFDADAPYHLIFLPDLKVFLLMDTEMLNSMCIQMYVFERYDPALFEPVLLNAVAKAYRVKI